jgi:peptide/nickel transport system permease protein
MHLVAQRLPGALVALFNVTLIAAALVHISGDPLAVMYAGVAVTEEERQALLRQFGLDKPFFVQYAEFLGGVVRGDLGRSLITHRPALEMILERLPASAQLAASAMLIATTVGIPAGILAAVRPTTLVSRLAQALVILGQAIPTFFVGIALVFVFAIELRWLPSGGRLLPTSIILPAIALSLYPMARITKLLRASLVEVMGHDYVRTARSKGLTERRVVLAHALRNAALPVLTIISLQFGAVIGGAVVTEAVFSWPGVGSVAVAAISARDFPVVRAAVLVIAVIFILVNLVTDLAYAYLNPRIRFS